MMIKELLQGLAEQNDSANGSFKKKRPGITLKIISAGI
jgi:hypothetical protein